MSARQPSAKRSAAEAGLGAAAAAATGSGSVVPRVRAPLCPPTKRPDAAELTARPLSRVLDGTLSTMRPQLRQQTLSFGARAPPAQALRAPPPRQPTRELPGGVIEVIDDDDEAEGAAATPAAAAAAAAAAPAAMAAPPRHLPLALPALPSGVIFLPRFLALEQQGSILGAADLVTAVVPFTIPGVRHPYSGVAAFGNVYMSHAGRAWEGTKSTYFPDGPHTPSRFHNHLTGALCDVPPVPAAFIEAARSATAEALRRAPGAFDPLPLDDGPDSLCCVINYYTQFCNISPHSDGSEPSLKKGKTWPVVSISVGDAADFTLLPNDDPASAVVITLRSGDVLLFGGASRLIRHEVACPQGSVTRPSGLRMVDGRLNVTLRHL